MSSLHILLACVFLICCLPWPSEAYCLCDNTACSDVTNPTTLYCNGESDAPTFLTSLTSLESL